MNLQSGVLCAIHAGTSCLSDYAGRCSEIIPDPVAASGFGHHLVYPLPKGRLCLATFSDQYTRGVFPSRKKTGTDMAAFSDTARAHAGNFGAAKPNDAAKRRTQALTKANRVPCGARRRRDGLPCEALSEPGKRRCKWHGGCSTGPRTAKGKARVAANLPKSGS